MLTKRSGVFYRGIKSHEALPRGFLYPDKTTSWLYISGIKRVSWETRVMQNRTMVIQ